MQIIRRIGAVVLIIAALGIWFGMKPAQDTKAGTYHSAISAALDADTANNAKTEGAPQQTVVNGWTAKDLLTVIAQEGASQPPVDERPAALLVLVIIGLGLILMTTRPDVPVLATGYSNPPVTTAVAEPVPE
jgi:hypothetical protein